MPIRTRDDMNLIWNGIENDLKMLFPMPEQEQPLSEVVQGKDSKILLKVFLVAIMTAVLATIFLVGLADNNYISGDALPFLTPIAFAFLIPILIYFRDRKDLEWIAFSFEGQKQIQVVNWKQLLIRTGIAFFAMCLAIRIFASESFFKSASVLGVAAILPLVLYRMKRNDEGKIANDSNALPQARKYLKSIGRYSLFLFLGMFYWWAVLVLFQQENSLHYLFIMPFLTTIGFFIIRFLQKRSAHSP
jgi:uncharacterized membrane protein